MSFSVKILVPRYTKIIRTFWIIMCHKWPWVADNIRSIYRLYPVIHCLFTSKTALHNTLKCSVLRETCLGRTVSWEKHVLGETCLGRNMSWEKHVLGEKCLGSPINYWHWNLVSEICQISWCYDESDFIYVWTHQWCVSLHFLSLRCIGSIRPYLTEKRLLVL